MFYTGARETPTGTAQSIGAATSADLITWHKVSDGPIVEPDPLLYECFPGTKDSDAFRDPWVFADGEGWHMLITARSPHGVPDDRGVVGHATSTDLRTWVLQSPLSPPGQGFGFMEVFQVVTVHDRSVLVFSCPADEVAASNNAVTSPGSIWVAPSASPTGPFDIANAYQVTTDGAYSGRLVRAADEEWVLMAFGRDQSEPHFLELLDPRPVQWRAQRLSAT